ncbi:MAG: M20/M25/M40 family metallo-hydrolase [Clostridia bacterium]|nr:M20/M25/M40 family metallo-hydrolase [Clostridia bacterium]
MIGIVIAIAVGAVLLALVGVVVVRTLMFKPTPCEKKQYETLEFDGDKAVNDLAEMIKCKTVSSNDKSLEDEAEFDKFKALLPKLFPNIHEKCEFEAVGDRGLLYRYKGESSDAPTVLMAHFDVVSVEQDKWDKPAFDAIIEDGVMWGRGTLDTKGTLNGAMQALEKLISEGFVPKNDIYLAFAGDEEINGHGAPMIVDLFEDRGITPGLVFDEGGAVVQNVFPGVKAPCALIGIAEKGMLNLEFSYSGNGGHASSPKPHTPVGILSSACVAVENHPFKFTVTKPAKAMFNTLARHSSFAYRMIFANLWLFGGILNMICKKSGGELNALMRTTCAFTQMEGSKGMNVIPPSAKMVANLRLIGGETTDSAMEYIRRVIDNEDIKLTKINGMNPSVISRTDCEAWERVCDAVQGTWQDAIVSPYLMVACSDSRHWGRISDRVYRFSAMALSSEERSTIHGNNERVPLETVKKTVEMYLRLIKKC